MSRAQVPSLTGLDQRGEEEVQRRVQRSDFRGADGAHEGLVADLAKTVILPGAATANAPNRRRT